MNISRWNTGWCSCLRTFIVFCYYRHEVRLRLRLPTYKQWLWKDKNRHKCIWICGPGILTLYGYVWPNFISAEFMRTKILPVTYKFKKTWCSCHNYCGSGLVPKHFEFPTYKPPWYVFECWFTRMAVHDDDEKDASTRVSYLSHFTNGA